MAPYVESSRMTSLPLITTTLVRCTDQLVAGSAPHRVVAALHADLYLTYPVTIPALWTIIAQYTCRPFDPTKASNDTGSWCWVGLPKSVLINGQGNYYDCEDPYKRVVSNSTTPRLYEDKALFPAVCGYSLKEGGCRMVLGAMAEPQ